MSFLEDEATEFDMQQQLLQLDLKCYYLEYHFGISNNNCSVFLENVDSRLKHLNFIRRAIVVLELPKDTCIDSVLIKSRYNTPIVFKNVSALNIEINRLTDIENHLRSLQTATIMAEQLPEPEPEPVKHHSMMKKIISSLRF